MVVDNYSSRKKFFLIVALFCLMFFFLFQVAYAKYKKTAESYTNADIAKWNILINNETIKNKTTLENDIIPVIVADTYVRNDVIAPGSIGYFDVVIDSTDSDVTFDYEILSQKYDNNTIKDIIITDYSINNGVTNEVSDNVVNGTIDHNTPTTSIRVFFQWNEATGLMDNREDTTAAWSDTANGKIKVVITLTQKRS